MGLYLNVRTFIVIGSARFKNAFENIRTTDPSEIERCIRDFCTEGVFSYLDFSASEKVVWSLSLDTFAYKRSLVASGTYKFVVHDAQTCGGVTVIADLNKNELSFYIGDCPGDEECRNTYERTDDVVPHDFLNVDGEAHGETQGGSTRIDMRTPQPSAGGGFVPISPRAALTTPPTADDHNSLFADISRVLETHNNKRKAEHDALVIENESLRNRIKEQDDTIKEMRGVLSSKEALIANAAASLQHAVLMLA